MFMGYGNPTTTYNITNFANNTGTLCFGIDTMILCDNTEIPIQNLNIGDLILTYSNGLVPVKKIIKGFMVNNPSNPLQCMFKHISSSLIVTGGHSILVDELSEEEQIKSKKLFGGELQIIDDKFLLLSCISNEFEQKQNNEIYRYFHLLLENYGDENKRYAIWANGILTETPNEKTIKNI